MLFTISININDAKMYGVNGSSLFLFALLFIIKTILTKNTTILAINNIDIKPSNPTTTPSKPTILASPIPNAPCVILDVIANIA